MNRRYNHLCNLQGKCESLSPKDSWELTELIKKDDTIEAVIFLLEMIINQEQDNE